MYPLYLNLSQKKCLVIGGGKIALRKVIALLRAKATVTVIARQCCKRFGAIERCIQLHSRSFTEEDIDRSFSLVIGATNNQEVNRLISERASYFNIPCNIVDQPDLCTFFVPAVVRRGDITVAVSTGGTAPRLARYVKTVIARTVEPELTELAAYCALIRKRIHAEISSAPVRARFWEALFTNDPLDDIKRFGWSAFHLKTEQLIQTHIHQAKANETE